MLEVLKNKERKYIVIAIFILFFIIMLVQHKYIGIYFDDYAYFSLSYSYEVPGVNGHEYTYAQMFDFLKGHYMEWGGRVLAFGIELTLFKVGGLKLLKFTQVCILTLIFVFIYLITSKFLKNDKGKILLALFIVSTFGLFDMSILRSGIYWFAASVLYVFPILWLLMFIYFYNRYDNIDFKNNTFKIFYLVFCGICLFFASFSQEQIGMMAFIYIVAKAILNYIKNKKISKIDIIMICISLIGFTILMIAPGNEIRKQHPSSKDFYNLSFSKKIIKNVPQVILGNFSQFGTYYTFVLFIFSIIVSLININSKIGKKHIHISNILSSSLVCISIICCSGSYFINLYGLKSSNIYHTIIIIFYFIQFILLLYSFTLFLYNRFNITPVIILYIGILSQMVIVMAPYFAARLIIPLAYCLFLIYAYVLVDIFNRFYKSNIKYLVACIIISMSILSFYIMLVNIRGYRSNSFAMVTNDKILTEASKNIKAGKKIDKIELMKYNSLWYAGELPNSGDNNYIYIWIKKYYDIPEEVEIFINED